MRKCLVLLGTGMLFHAVLVSGCAEGEDNKNVFVPEIDASAEASSTGGADASTEAGKEGGAGTSGSAGASGAAGSGGSAGSATGGSAGAAGNAGSSTGGSSTGGSAGSAGTGGSSTGGSAGSAGTGGSSTGGSAGSAGTGGSSAGGSNTGGSSGATAYSNTIEIDGTNDFSLDDDLFATTSTGYTGYVSWDANNVYIGMDGPDIQSVAPNRMVLVYFGDPAQTGSTTGHAYTSQQPLLPFDAHWLFAWGTTGGYKELLEFTGNQWTDVTSSSSVNAVRTGSIVEISISRQTLKSPAKLRMHLSMINEHSSGEWTFAGVPSSSFSDLKDPDYGKYFEFDLLSPKAPNDYTALP